jgi:hypothetical protein
MTASAPKLQRSVPVTSHNGCYSCWTKRQQLTLAIWKYDGDLYCEACRQEDGIDAAACEQINGSAPQSADVVEVESSAKIRDDKLKKVLPMKKAIEEDEERLPCLRTGCKGTYRKGAKWPFCTDDQHANYQYTLTAAELMKAAGIPYKLPASVRRARSKVPRKDKAARLTATKIRRPGKRVAVRGQLKDHSPAPTNGQASGTLVFSEQQLDRVIVTMPFDVKLKAVQLWLNEGAPA